MSAALWALFGLEIFLIGTGTICIALGVIARGRDQLDAAITHFQAGMVLCALGVLASIAFLGAQAVSR